MSILKTENLKIALNGKALLDGLSFEIDEKGIYAILAKTSDELTALANALAGVIELDGGSIFYKDNELTTKKSGRALKAKIGYVPKESFLYPDMTVYEVLDFTGKMRDVAPDKRIRQIKEALELLVLSEKGEVLVKGLSFSEKKRLLLANALIGNPSVLILDEPCANVMSEDSEIIRDVIDMLAKKKVIIITTEKVTFANGIADYIGIISGGEMALWSSLENIKAKLNNDSKALAKTFIAFTDSSKGGSK